MNLNFFTASYPYGKGEYIIENEIDYLRRDFDDIRIFPNFFSGDRFLLDNRQETGAVCIEEYTGVKLDIGLKVLVFRFFLIELFLTKKKRFYLKQTKKRLSFLKDAAKRAKFLENESLLLPNSVNYSYWMNHWALVLTFLKKRGTISNFIFRCGGFDIWDDRHEGNYLPFRSLIYKYADSIYPNSKLAESYLKKCTSFGEKITCQYLGTTDHGKTQEVESEKLTIVSCSNLIPIKRVELIVEILALVEKPLKWVHFGDGPEMLNISNLTKSKLQKHHVELKGMMSNDKILSYYQNNQVDLFMTTSETESLPVSIQEAISFGVPIIATNVGGMAEIVNDITGILLPENLDIKSVAETITNWKNSKFSQSIYRDEIRRFWLDNFNADKLYPQFISEIKAIAEANTISKKIN